MNMIVLGSKVKDKITGYSGVVTGFVVYLTGCNQALVVSKAGKDGSFKGEWLDEQRLDVDKKAPIIKLNNAKTPGADFAPPKR
jgi:hypothetical protein